MVEGNRKPVGNEVLSKQLLRYGGIISEALAFEPNYSEDQCGECPYDHRCCGLMVAITPYEALGIMSWLKVHRKDWRDVFALVKMRAEVFKEFFQREPGEEFKTLGEGLQAWADKKLKCVFYDHGKKECSIYPIRPTACRKAYGKGDCSDEAGTGISTAIEDEEVFASRALRVRVGQLIDIGQHALEMCSLITMLQEPDARLMVDPPNQTMLTTEALFLTDEQLLWGVGPRRVENPMLEEGA